MQQPVAAEGLHHRAKNLLARLQLALELLEAEASLSATQQAFVSTALRTVEDLDTTLRDELPS